MGRTFTPYLLRVADGVLAALLPMTAEKYRAHVMTAVANETNASQRRVYAALKAADAELLSK